MANPPGFVSDADMAQLEGASASSDSAGARPGFISDADMAALEAPSFGANMLSGAEAAPGAVLQLPGQIVGIGSDIINAHTPEQGIKAAQEVGGFASGIAGAGIGAETGAVLGAPLAPFTMGLSVPAGAVIGGALGGAAGLTGWDWLNQAMGVAPQTTPEEDTSKLAKNIGAGLFLGSASEAIGGAASLAKKAASGTANAAERSLLGYNNTPNKAKPVNIDDQGAIVKASQAAEQVTKKEIKFRDLKETNFWKTVNASDTPAEVAHKLSIFKENTGESLGAIVDTAASLENAMLSKQAPWQNQQYLTKTNPDFSGAQDFVDSAIENGVPNTSALETKLSAVQDAWNSSGQTFADLKAIQEKFGLVNKKTFGSAKTADETLMDTLNDHIYGALAGSLKQKAGLLDPALGAHLTKVNKAYSAAATFEPTAFAASLKSGFKGALKRNLFNLGSAGEALLPGVLGALTHSFMPVEALATFKGLQTLADINPNLTRAAARGTGSLVDTIGSALPPESLFTGATQAGMSGLSPQESQHNPIDHAIANLISQPASPQMLNVRRVSAQEPKFSENVTNPLPKQQELDNLVHAVVQQESSGNPDAVSKVGATGLMQLMPDTGKDMMRKRGLNPDEYRPKNKVLNQMLGTEYLKELLGQFGDTKLALAAYIAGPKRLTDWIAQYGTSDWDELKGHIEKRFPQSAAYPDQVLARI